MLKISEIKSVLSHIINNNRYLESRGQKKNTILLESEAGIGKTSVVQQIASEFNLGCVKINLSQIEQTGDLLGFPIREFQTENKSEWISEKDPQLAKAKLSKNTRTSFCPPAWVPTDGSGVILLLDDFTRAPIHIMQAVMEIIDRQEYISWKLPKDCHVFLTSNPSDSGDYIVTALDNAQQTRYIKLKMKFDVNEWAAWAEHQGVDSRCINFLLLHPEMIKGIVNARLATDYFNSISSITDFSLPDSLNLINLLGSGSVGDEFSTTFALFINNKLDKLPHPDQLLSYKTDDAAINAIKTCTGLPNTATYKQSIASVLSTRLYNYCTKLMNSKDFLPKVHPQRMSAIIKSKIFSGDINYNLIKNLNCHKQFSQLTEDKEILSIITK